MHASRRRARRAPWRGRRRRGRRRSRGPRRGRDTRREGGGRSTGSAVVGPLIAPYPAVVTNDRCDGYGAAMLDHSQFFHIGIRVTDSRQRWREIGEQTGVTWASVQDRPMSVWLPGLRPDGVAARGDLLDRGSGAPRADAGPGGFDLGRPRRARRPSLRLLERRRAPPTPRSLLADGWTLELAAAVAGGRLRPVHLRSFAVRLSRRAGVDRRQAALRTVVGGRLAHRSRDAAVPVAQP